MSAKGSVTSKGGVGTNFEQAVQAAFLVVLLTGGPAPCIPASQVERLDFQTTKHGYETDDLLVLARAHNGQLHRLLLQIKNNLTISSKNALFEEVINAFWHDYQRPELFDPLYDRLVIVKSGLTEAERNHVKVLLNWARHHADSNGFLLEVRRVKEKLQRLEIFRDVLVRVSRAAVSDDELWRFLCCVELLEYDYLTTASADETALLHLIKLTKGNGASATEIDIWHEAIQEATQLDNNGGSVTRASLAQQPLYQRFTLTRLDAVTRVVARLANDSHTITALLKNTVGGVHLNRPASRQLVREALDHYEVVLVTGEAGVGKSALTWDVLAERFEPEVCFVFRADQFNVPHLRHVFDRLGNTDSLEDLLSTMALLPKKVLFIDSAEKLLEDAPDGAFSQLLSQLQAVGRCQLVLTVRQYAVELLVHRYDLSNVGRVVVPSLDEMQLASISVAVPALAGPLANPQLRPLLRSLKYLELAITLLDRTSTDYSTLTQLEFKHQLWRYVVEDASRPGAGLPQKRNNAFLAVALLRARQLALFVSPDGVDEQALEALTHDGLLGRDGNEWRFAPTHDVLEDLALVKHISRQWQENSGATEFFKTIGSEPALRRGFRLWVEESLTAEVDRILVLLEQALVEPSIERYWIDELLVAVLRSSRAEGFFEQFKAELLADEAALLIRCLHLLRTACRQPDPTGQQPATLLYPVGSGWKAALRFLTCCLALPIAARILIVRVLLDWSSVLLSGISSLPPEAEAVKTLVWQVFDELENGDSLWLADAEKKPLERLILLAYELTELAQPEITALVERALATDNERGNTNWRLRQFYDQVRASCLDGVYTATLCSYLPELVVRVANYEWKAKPKPDEQYHRFSSPDREEERFGLDTNLDYHPPGIYKTPILLLLRHNPVVGLEFVIDFVNYCTDRYRAYHHLEEFVTFTTVDGTIVRQYGDVALWMAYRESSVFPDVLESVLISTEKFLLELAGHAVTTGSKSLQWCFTFLLTNSHSVALTSILASVTMAYPEAVGAIWLPLLTVREFIEWDYNRVSHEQLRLTDIAHDDRLFAEQERRAFNRLPHRTLYEQGLVSFVADYQFRQGVLTSQIHKILDHHRADLTERTDYLWRKHLSDMDARQWAPVSYDSEQGLFQLQPSYDEQILAERAAAAPYFTEWSQGLRAQRWISNILDLKSDASYDWASWEAIYVVYTQPDRRPNHDNRPVGLALVGLRHFAAQLTSDQRLWCQRTILNGLAFRLTHVHDHDTEAVFEEINNLFDHKFVLQSFALLMGLAQDDETRIEIKRLLLNALIAHFDDHLAIHLLHHCRAELFVQYPDLLLNTWGAVVAYAQSMKEPERPSGYSLEQSLAWDEERKHRRVTSQALLNDLAAELPTTVVVEQLSWDTHVPSLLLVALQIIPPDTTQLALLAFVQQLLQLTVKDLQRDEARGSGSRSQQPTRQLQYRELAVMQGYVPRFLLHTDSINALAALNSLLNGLNQLPAREYGPGEDLYKFVRQILDNTINELDTLVANAVDSAAVAAPMLRFWELWEHLLAQMNAAGTLRLAPKALLDVAWRSTSTSWKPLEENRRYYPRAMQQLGALHLKSVLNVLTTIGDKTLLPGALTTIVEIAKANPVQRLALYTGVAEKFSERLFHRHLRTIKSQKSLIADFIWLLTAMADAGLSSAYLLREDVITFRN